MLQIVGVATACCAFFAALARCDKFASRELKRDLYAYLTSKPRDHTHTWTAMSPRLLDAVFGPRPLSVRFFIRSCCASVLMVVVMTAFWFLFNLRYVLSDDVLFAKAWREFALVVGLLMLALNLVPDYLSLVESRYVVRRMAGKRWHVVLGWLVGDFVVTTAIIVIAVFVASRVIASEKTWWHDLTLAIQTVRAGFSLRQANGAMGIFIYTTYTTSVWVWLYAATAIAAKALYRGRKLRWAFVNLFDAKTLRQKPFMVLGRVGAVLTTAVTVIAMAVSAVF